MTTIEGEVTNISHQIMSGMKEGSREENINGSGSSSSNSREDIAIQQCQKTNESSDQIDLSQEPAGFQSSYPVVNMLDCTTSKLVPCSESNNTLNANKNNISGFAPQQDTNLKQQGQYFQIDSNKLQEEVMQLERYQEGQTAYLSNSQPAKDMEIEEQELQEQNPKEQSIFIENSSGIQEPKNNQDASQERQNQILSASNQITLQSNLIKPLTPSVSDSNRIDSEIQNSPYSQKPGKTSEGKVEKGSQVESKDEHNLESISNDDSKKNNNSCSQENHDKIDIEEQQDPPCEKLVAKEFGMENVLKHVYNPLALEALQGDIFIDLNYDYANSQLFGQPSLMNQYKHLTSVENFEERGLVELNLQSHYTPVYDFTHLTDALCDHQEPSLRELGEKLLKYQKVAYKMQEKGKQFREQQEQEIALNENNNSINKDNNNINGQPNSKQPPKTTSHQDLGAAMVESYKKFEKEARKFLSELKKRSKIFFYTLRQLSLTSFSYELKKYGYSAEFLQLLGYNVQQFKNLTVRKGMIELQNFKGRIALNKMSLDLLIGEIKDCVRIKTSYITSDNLELQVDGIVKQIFNTAHSSEIFPYFQFLSIIVLDVQTNTMKEIYSIRHTNKQIQHQQNQMQKNQQQNQENSSKQQQKQQQLGNSQSHSDSEENQNSNKHKKSPKKNKSKGKKGNTASELVCSPSKQPFHNNGDRDILEIVGQRRQSEDIENQINSNDCNSSGNQQNNSKIIEEIQGNNQQTMAKEHNGQEDKQQKEDSNGFINTNKNNNSPSPKKEIQNNSSFASPMKHSGDHNQLSLQSQGNKASHDGVLLSNQKEFSQPLETKQLPEKNLHESQSVLSQSGACQQSSGSVFGGPALPSILPNSEDLDVDEYYSMETQILLDKFYENSSSARRKVKRIKRNTVQADRNQVKTMLSTHEHLLSGKTCGFRFLKPICKKSSFCNNNNKQK